MGYRRGLPAVASGVGLVACGVAGTIAWGAGWWALLTGAVLGAIWLGMLHWWAMVRPRDIAPPAVDTRAEGDAMALRVLLDAAPTPLLAIEGDAVRALNRAARGMFATDNRVLPAPSLIDPAATRFLHEARTWRIDRVAMPDGRSVVALIDIEQEERTAEARAAADLIQVLGHELMNGLAPIVSLAESGIAALERPAIDTDLLHEILGTLSRRAEGLQRFTEAYRALARLPAPTRRLVRLGEMADDLARLFAGRWPGVALSVWTEAAEWPLDRDQLCQALWALLQNAAEACVAMPLPQVALRIQLADHGLRIEVADNGPGVPPDRAHHIFRPFHTTKPGGTGVGLTLARQIVLGHGGLLTLQQAPGTVFQMLLPKER